MATIYGKSNFSEGIHYYNIPDTDTIDYYFLKSPFDLNSRIFKYKLDPTNRISRTDNMKISNDGFQIYVCETRGDVLNYKLTLPFRLNTAIYDYTISNLFSEEATCFEIVNKGYSFFYNNGGTLLQFDLSVPYDISSRTQTGSYGGFKSTGGPGDPAFSPDGLKMVLGARGRNYIEGGSLTTPFDINTYTQETTFITPDVDPSCCKWNQNGTKLFVRHSSPDMVNEYATSNPYSLINMTFVKQVFNNSSFAAGGHDFNYNF